MSKRMVSFLNQLLYCDQCVEQNCYTKLLHRTGSWSVTDASQALVAQLDRVSASEAEGHRFDSCRAHHENHIDRLK